MTGHPLSIAMQLTSGNRGQLIASTGLTAALDELCTGANWVSACREAAVADPEWLRDQISDHNPRSVPNAIGEVKGPEARAAFLAQGAAVAAAASWNNGDGISCVELARYSARWWSVLERLVHEAPDQAPRLLATLADTLEAERARHQSQVWAPVEDMVLAAAGQKEVGRAGGSRIQTITWIPGLGEDTIPGKLELEVVPGGVPGLWRAAEAGLTRTDATFLEALQASWAWATVQGGLELAVSVKWRLLDSGGSRASAGRGSGVALACAVGLHQLSLPHQLGRKLDRSTGYLAGLTPDGRLEDPLPSVPALPGERSSPRYMITTKTQPRPLAPLVLRPASSVPEAVRLGRRPVRVRQGKWASVACLAALIAVIASTVVARSGTFDSQATATATASARQAQALVLANAAEAVVATDPSRAIAAAVAAYKLEPNDAIVKDAVLAAAGRDPRAVRYLAPTSEVTGLSLSSDGRLAAAALANGQVEAWNLGTTPPRTIPIPQSPGRTSAIAFIPGTHTLIASGSGVALWDLSDVTNRSLTETAGGVTAVSVEASGASFATASPRGVRLWSTAAGTSRLLSSGPAEVVSLAPDGHAVLTGSSSGQVALISTASGIRMTVTLPAAVTSVLLAPSGTAYAVTAAGELYCFNHALHPLRAAVAVPADTKLGLRPGADARQLTPVGTVVEHRPAELALTASNAILLPTDDPARIATGSGKSIDDLSSAGTPIQGLGQAIYASDGDGQLAATVLSNGQIRISKFDLSSNPSLMIPDISEAAEVNQSTLALVTGLVFTQAMAALIDPETGKVSALISFRHQPDNIFRRPVVTGKYIIDTGASLSSLDIWKIEGGHLETVDRDDEVASTAISGIAVDEKSGLVFLATGNGLQVRKLSSPSHELANETLQNFMACLTAVPAQHLLYACTASGIVEVKYSPDGKISTVKTLNSIAAVAVDVASSGQILLVLPNGNEILLPDGFSQPGAGETTLASGDSSTLASYITPNAAIVSGINSHIYAYSTKTSSTLAANLVGSGDYAVALWESGDQSVSGAMWDGALFTLPPTLPSLAAAYACRLLASPGAEWVNDFGATPAAAYLPASGGCPG